MLEVKLKRSYQEIKRVIWNFTYRDIEEIKDDKVGNLNEPNENIQLREGICEKRVIFVSG